MAGVDVAELADEMGLETSVAMPKIYVINLKRCQNRRHHIKKRLDNLSLSHEFVTGIDHASDEDHAKVSVFYNRILANPSTRWMNEGLAACTLSHYKALSRIAETAENGGVVVEDDAIFRKQFPEAIKLCHSQRELDLVLLSYYRFDGEPVALNSRPLLKAGKLSIHSIAYLPGVVSGMGYYISQRAASLLASRSLPKAPDDWQTTLAILNRMGTTAIGAVFPPTMHADAEESSINYKDESINLKKRLAQIARSTSIGRALLRDIINLPARRRRDQVTFIDCGEARHESMEAEND